jgi:hypothetical protein
MNIPTVHNEQTSRRAALGFGGALVAAGLFFLAVAIAKDARLAFMGQRGEGEITKVTVRTSPDRSSRRKGESLKAYRARTKTGGKSHVLTVRYAPAGAEPMEVETLATWGYEGKVGDHVKLVYFPDAPENAEIDNARQVWLPLATGLTVGPLGLVGGVLLFRKGRRMDKGALPARAAGTA